MGGSAPSPEPKLSACCISHEFYRAASKAPDKIAVIHASGGAKIIAGEFQKHSDIKDNEVVPNDELIEAAQTSSQPPVYKGDQCFTYSDIIFAVNSLSSRLRGVLDGADDPYLIKPQSGDRPCASPLTHEQASVSVESSNPSLCQLAKFKSKYTPRVIGVYMEPSVEYIVAVLSILRCGEAFMPLDPSWPRERILSVVSSSRADLVIGCEYSMEDNYYHELDKLHWLIDSGCCPLLSMSMKYNAQEQRGLTCLDCPCESKISRLFCYLMYTSGSTGKPKGICGTEQGLLNRFIWMQELYPLHGEEYLFFKTSISFIDHLQEFLGSLLTTSTLVIPPFSALKENPFYVADFLESYSITRLIAVPSLMKLVLPSLQNPAYTRVHSCLKLLVLSGEVLHQSLCERLLQLLPQTAVLNLYGSTEVSGDCTYFDYKHMPLIHESETLSSVPIGLPISNCKVVLVGENAPDEGEICVGGLCLGAGYFDYPFIVPLDSVELPEDACIGYPCGDHRLGYYFKTGDYARRLESGDLVFLGREDRTIKINGHRIALEEIELAFREHQDIFDAAVLCKRDNGEISHIEAHLVLKQKDKCNESFKSSLRRWIVNKLPQAMVPGVIFFTESLPICSTGKVDYNLLASSLCSKARDKNCIGKIWDSDLLKIIKKVFCNALMVENICMDDNFFEMGGNSISAAYAAYNLGINMKLLYSFPTPLKLQSALRTKMRLSTGIPRIDANIRGDSGATKESALLDDSSTRSIPGSKIYGRLYRALSSLSNDNPVKYLKRDSSVCSDPNDLKFNYFWNSDLLHTACSFTRCNKTMHEGKCEEKNPSPPVWCQRRSGERLGSMQELWKVYMESCVDASPLIVFKESNVYLFIGSHSQKFVCMEAKSGFLLWEAKLDGRIECSAAVLDNFSQVVVGCYQGNIYFLQFSDGCIRWKFQTHGEVKSQPVLDKQRHLVWCGSYDHNLYALDYKNYCCIYKLPCGGSIFGSPAIDEMQEKLFVASTSGRVTAISVKALAFAELWIQDLEVPIFGSLSINSSNGDIICCLVDGSVIALDTGGCIIWKANTGGPVFAGPCLSDALPSQVLVCSRDGSIYSFELEKGKLLWQYAIGHPITSSAYVDESMELAANASCLSDRLVCVCTSSGSIIVLRISSLDATGGTSQSGKTTVREFARLDLEGDIFSSPVMIGGKIFVGCRDDYVYCIGIECN